MIREREGSEGVKLACRGDPDGRPVTRRMVDGKEVPSSLWMEEMVRGGDRLTLGNITNTVNIYTAILTPLQFSNHWILSNGYKLYQSQMEYDESLPNRK